MTRLEANKQIILIIAAAAVAYPDLRFGQILRNLDAISEHRDENGTPTYWVNGFYEEPEVTLERMKQQPLVQELIKNMSEGFLEG